MVKQKTVAEKFVLHHQKNHRQWRWRRRRRSFVADTVTRSSPVTKLWVDIRMHTKQKEQQHREKRFWTWLLHMTEVLMLVVLLIQIMDWEKNHVGCHQFPWLVSSHILKSNMIIINGQGNTLWIMFKPPFKGCRLWMVKGVDFISITTHINLWFFLFLEVKNQIQGRCMILVYLIREKILQWYLRMKSHRILQRILVKKMVFLQWLLLLPMEWWRNLIWLSGFESQLQKILYIHFVSQEIRNLGYKSLFLYCCCCFLTSGLFCSIFDLFVLETLFLFLIRWTKIIFDFFFCSYEIKKGIKSFARTHPSLPGS